MIQSLPTPLTSLCILFLSLMAIQHTKYTHTLSYLHLWFPFSGTSIHQIYTQVTSSLYSSPHSCFCSNITSSEKIFPDQQTQSYSPCHFLGPFIFYFYLQLFSFPNIKDLPLQIFYIAVFPNGLDSTKFRVGAQKIFIEGMSIECNASRAAR